MSKLENNSENPISVLEIGTNMDSGFADAVEQSRDIIQNELIRVSKELGISIEAIEIKGFTSPDWSMYFEIITEEESFKEIASNEMKDKFPFTNSYSLMRSSFLVKQQNGSYKAVIEVNNISVFKELEEGSYKKVPAWGLYDERVLVPSLLHELRHTAEKHLTNQIISKPGFENYNINQEFIDYSKHVFEANFVHHQYLMSSLFVEGLAMLSEAGIVDEEGKTHLFRTNILSNLDFQDENLREIMLSNLIAPTGIYSDTSILGNKTNLVYSVTVAMWLDLIESKHSGFLEKYSDEAEGRSVLQFLMETQPNTAQEFIDRFNTLAEELMMINEFSEELDISTTNPQLTRKKRGGVSEEYYQAIFLNSGETKHSLVSELNERTGVNSINSRAILELFGVDIENPNDISELNVRLQNLSSYISNTNINLVPKTPTAYLPYTRDKKQQ